MRRNKDFITFEVAALNPRTGEAYIIEDGLSTLHYLVEQGRKHRAKQLGKRYRESYWGRKLTTEDKILEELIWSAEWIHIQLKIRPRLMKLLKNVDSLNKEAER